jgi:ABC-type branched-subunit amino acid transport system substrate-binding protein
MDRGECAFAVQISYASTSAALSDRSVYPNLFRTVPSDEPLASALATVMQYYGWRTLSILIEQESQFIQASELKNKL